MLCQQSNDTLLAINRLKDLVKGLDLTIKQLRVEGEFQRKFLNIVKLAKSPFVQLMLANFNVDPKVLDTVFNGLLHDKQVSDIIETVANIFECFSVNRFIGVQSEKELEDLALELNKKKLFYGAIYFGNDGYEKNKEFSYKIRMDIDNTPITLENRNRFWFPGPNGNFELNMRYHRGFIQIQHLMDQAIIKTVVEAENAIREQEWLRTTTTTTTTEASTTSEATAEDVTDSEENTNELDSNENNQTIDSDVTTVSDDEAATEDVEITTLVDENVEIVQSNSTDLKNKTEKTRDKAAAASNTEPSEVVQTTLAPVEPQKSLVRKKRQFDFLENMFGGTPNEKKSGFRGIEVGNTHTYTKQFPYPKYRRDDFLTGLYLAQCIQLIFFFALIVQVSNAVRNRIWMRESGNSTVN